MPKKVKLSINTLKIQSFVTTLDKAQAAPIKGGESNTYNCQLCTNWTGCESCSCGGTCFSCKMAC